MNPEMLRRGMTQMLLAPQGLSKSNFGQIAKGPALKGACLILQRSVLRLPIAEPDAMQSRLHQV
jgi:hypothetical protein